MLLWSKRRQIDRRFTSWLDITTYAVPYTGEYNFNDPEYRLFSVVSRMSHSGGIPGSSFGAENYRLIGKHPDLPNHAIIEVSFNIGE